MNNIRREYPKEVFTPRKGAHFVHDDNWDIRDKNKNVSRKSEDSLVSAKTRLFTISIFQTR